MEERSQRAKIGGSGRRWQVLPVLVGVGCLIAMLMVAQTPAPPMPLPTATVVAEMVVTPSISSQPTPSIPINSIPAADFGDQQLLLIDDMGGLKFWDGENPTQARGDLQYITGPSNWALTIDQQREMLFFRTINWLEARSLRDNRRLWQIPISTYLNATETTIVDVISDPLNQLVWLVEKQRTRDPFQPATVRLRGLDSASSLELQRYQTPLLHDLPQVLPTINGPWLLADGQLLPFNPSLKAFGEPFMRQLEFAQIAPDGKRALVFGAGIVSEIDLLNQQILRQTPLIELPQSSSIARMLASSNFNYVAMVGSNAGASDLTQEIMVYDRDGKNIGSWRRQLIQYGILSIEPEINNRIRFLDDQRMLLLDHTGAIEMIDFTTGQSQILELAATATPSRTAFVGLAVIPKLAVQSSVANPELAFGGYNPFSNELPTLTTTPKLIGLSQINDQVAQLWSDGSTTLIKSTTNYVIARHNATPLFVNVTTKDLAIFDPTSQTTYTFDLEPAEAQTLSDLTGISAANNQSIVLCYSYHLDASGDSRVNRCLELELQTGQMTLFAELPAATYLTPIYWDGQQLTIIGKTYLNNQYQYLVWQTLANNRAQGQILLDLTATKAIWYKVGAPTIIYQQTSSEIYSYQLREKTSSLIAEYRSPQNVTINLAPDGQHVVLLERQHPLKYGTSRMLDTTTGAELWRDSFANNQIGYWSGNSQFYLTKNYQSVNSSLNVYTHQGQQGHSFLAAEGFGSVIPDWSGQRVVLQTSSDLFLLERLNEHWFPSSLYSDSNPTASIYDVISMVYVYPPQ